MWGLGTRYPCQAPTVSGKLTAWPQIVPPPHLCQTDQGTPPPPPGGCTEDSGAHPHHSPVTAGQEAWGGGIGKRDIRPPVGAGQFPVPPAHKPRELHRLCLTWVIQGLYRTSFSDCGSRHWGRGKGGIGA